MTFVEAAVEVLRRLGRPLHYKKITELAVRDELLSHTGKTPADTMALRLTQEVKSQGDSIIVEKRPGVYSIKESALDELNAKAAERAEREKARRRRREQAAEEARSLGADDPGEAEEEAASDGDEPKRRRRRRRGSRSSRGSERRSSKRRSRSRGSSRRRARSKSRGSTDGGRKRETKDREKSSRSEDSRSSEVVEGRTGARRRARGRRRSRERDTTSVDSQVKRSTSESGKQADSESRPSRRRSRGGRQASREERAPRSQARSSGRAQPANGATRHLEAGPVRLDGIAHAAYTVLKDADKEGMDIERLADEIFNRKLVKFHTHDAAATVQAALANDNQIRGQRGHRPLFTRQQQARWGLSERGLSTNTVQKEQAILSLSEEIRQDTVKHLAEVLVGVKNEALEHIALTLLERLGYKNIKVSKRSSDGDVYFTADWHQGLADVRVCIQVTLEAKGELGEEAVSDIRETLHHYSAAEGVIIHLGSINKEAVQQSRQDEQAPITLIDRDTFVALLVRHGIGVQTYTTPILMVDTEFIDLLKP